MTITTFIAIIILLACFGGGIVLIYDYLSGKISGQMAFAFWCIIIAIAGLTGIQLIT